jgi:hypothetical protein
MAAELLDGEAEGTCCSTAGTREDEVVKAASEQHACCSPRKVARTSCCGTTAEAE